MMGKEPADLTPSSVIQNLDAYSNFYEENPDGDEGSDGENVNTEMTIVDEDDFESEELPGNVILYY